MGESLVGFRSIALRLQAKKKIIMDPMTDQRRSKKLRVNRRDLDVFAVADIFSAVSIASGVMIERDMSWFSPPK